MKSIASIGGLILLLLVSVLAGMKAWSDAHFYDGYDPAQPLNTETDAPEALAEYRRQTFSFDSVPGQRVPSVIALPLEGEGPYPCIVFLHGIGQSKEFLDKIAAPFTCEGFAFVSFDQYTRGERRLPDDAGPIEEGLAFRRRAALTVIETRRLVDCLQTRPDIAPNRIYLVGASYGAITGATAAAFDERLRAVVLIYGGGDLPVLLRSEAAAEELGFLAGPAASLTAYLLAPADPVRHVAEISPRPVLFQNGKEDSLIPAEAARALQEAAREPKDILWYDGDHIGLDEATVRQVLNDSLDWLEARDAEIRSETEALPIPAASAP